VSSSLSDVACLAEVSIASASRVVNQSSYPISDEIPRRVERALTEPDYSPSLPARALVTRRSRMVGVISATSSIRTSRTLPGVPRTFPVRRAT